MTTLARCLNRSCPVRFRHGDDRYCRWCNPDGDGLSEAARQFAIDLSVQPGFASTDVQQSQMTDLGDSR